MFSRATKNAARQNAPSIVGADCAITGDLLSQGELQIDGRVDGDVRCNALVIGPTGVITGEISAETVRVLGAVTGQITARAVELAKTARILGDITHDCLSVEAGAYVEGRCNRLPADPVTKPRADAQESADAAPALPLRHHQTGNALLAAPADHAGKDDETAGGPADKVAVVGA